MKIGIHVKIGGGLPEAAKTAVAHQCNTFQMFSRSPRGGKARKFSPEELKNFQIIIEDNHINPIVVHIPYILNLANPDEDMHNFAISMVEEDLHRCDQLGAKYLVLHMGSHRGAGESTGLNQIVKGLETVLSHYHGAVDILLENTSGAGNEIGYSFEHLAWVLRELDSRRVAVCFDTCHAFGAGYDLSSKDQTYYTLDKMDKAFGLDRVKVIHCNDSAYSLNSKKDRHAHIGQGLIGEEGFRTLINLPDFANTAFILETPVNEEGDWARNLATLRSLIRND